MIVVIVWGSALLSGLLPQDGISWQGHLFGGIAGVLAAWVLADDRKPATARSSDIERRPTGSPCSPPQAT